MVRHYKRKAATMKWTEEDIANAIEHAKLHKNIMAAARLYKIPQTTLRDRITKNTAIIRKPGHPTVLTSQQEQEIVYTFCFLLNGGLVWVDEKLRE